MCLKNGHLKPPGLRFGELLVAEGKQQHEAGGEWESNSIPHYCLSAAHTEEQAETALLHTYTHTQHPSPMFRPLFILDQKHYPVESCRQTHLDV